MRNFTLTVNDSQPACQPPKAAAQLNCQLNGHSAHPRFLIATVKVIFTDSMKGKNCI